MRYCLFLFALTLFSCNSNSIQSFSVLENCSKQDSIINYQDSVLVQLNAILVNEDALKWRLNIIESSDSLKHILLEDNGYSKNKTEDAGWFTDAEYDGVYFEGEIINTASVAIYHDIKCELTFYSKTGTVIEKEAFIVYENLNPNESIFYQHPTHIPRATERYEISIVSVSTEYSKK